MLIYLPQACRTENYTVFPHSSHSPGSPWVPDQEQPPLLDLGLHTFPLLRAHLYLQLGVNRRGWMSGGLEPGYMKLCQIVSTFLNLKLLSHMHCYPEIVRTLPWEAGCVNTNFQITWPVLKPANSLVQSSIKTTSACACFTERLTAILHSEQVGVLLMLQYCCFRLFFALHSFTEMIDLSKSV